MSLKKSSWKKAVVISIAVHALLLTAGFFLATQFTESRSEAVAKKVEPIRVSLALKAKNVVREETDLPDAAEREAGAAESSEILSRPQRSGGNDAGVPSLKAVSGTGAAVVASSANQASALPQNTSKRGGKTARVEIIEKTALQYPPEARDSGWEGVVKIKVLISEKGLVKEAVLIESSGHRSIDEAALQGIRRWRFSPSYKDGEAVSAWVVAPVRFRLD